VKPENIRKLTDDALTERVAELCGGVWKPCECGKVDCSKHARWHWLDGTITNDCLNYSADLNAMHEAERNRLFPDSVVDSYKRSLCRVMMDDNDKRDMIFATARQRAEAFVTVKS